MTVKKWVNSRIPEWTTVVILVNLDDNLRKSAEYQVFCDVFILAKDERSTKKPVPKFCNKPFGTILRVYLDFLPNLHMPYYGIWGETEKGSTKSKSCRQWDSPHCGRAGLPA